MRGMRQAIMQLMPINAQNERGVHTQNKECAMAMAEGDVAPGFDISLHIYLVRQLTPRVAPFI